MGYIFTKFGVENIKRERKQHMYNGFRSIGATFQSQENVQTHTPKPQPQLPLPPKKKIGSPVLFSQNNRDIQTGMAVNLYWLSVFITSKGKIVFFGRNLQGENSLVKRISLGKFQINFLGRHFSERCFHCYFSERCFISYHLIMRVP